MTIPLSKPSGSDPLPDALTKKEIAAIRSDFSLHVALIMKREGLTKAQAAPIAWHETRSGFNRRLL